MFNHVVVGTDDVAVAKAFYDPVLRVVGVEEGVLNTLPSGVARVIYRGGGMSFVVTEPIDGEGARPANGGTIAFRCNSPEQVAEFHEVAIANGGVSIEDAPGVRMNPVVGAIYAAYVRDPDGNKLCATVRISGTN